MSPRVGVLFPADLSGRYAWSPREAATVLEGLGHRAGPLLPPSLGAPDPVVVVATRPEDLDVLDWLGTVRTLLVRAPASEPDEELLWEEGIAACDPVRTFMGLASLPVALDAALELEPGEGLAPAGREVLPRLPAGPWIPWTPALDYAPVATRVAQAVRCTGEGVFLDDAEGTVDLATGLRGPPGHVEVPVRTGQGRWTLGSRPTVRGPYGMWLHDDPLGRVGWSGFRCVYDWWAGSRDRRVPWVSSEHDWPIGHGKKLWGYEDNDPVRIELSADARYSLSHYEHDVLLTGGLPLRWRRFGELAVAQRFQEGPRVVLYASDPEEEGLGDPRVANDEDGRHVAPAVALGPGDTYAVDQALPTWRLTDPTAEEAERLDGQGTVLYRDRAVVWRADARLVGGSAGRLVLRTGTMLHGPDGEDPLELGRTPQGAVPVVGRANLVVWDAEGVRLV
ncbi:MAG: hypothetical protein H6734_07230 [Alphaproteobacteria bacterium]|nr:hypothetical protein [Alphaproteobacteria bacterium]